MRPLGHDLQARSQIAPVGCQREDTMSSFSWTCGFPHNDSENGHRETVAQCSHVDGVDYRLRRLSRRLGRVLRTRPMGWRGTYVVVRGPPRDIRPWFSESSASE